MPRRKAASKRIILPDPLLGSRVISKFINIVMQSGKKSVAEKIVYGALAIAVERTLGKASEEAGKTVASKGKKSVAKEGVMFGDNLHKSAIDIFNKAIDAIRPTVEVRSRRVGGATYQVPVEVKIDRGNALAMRWLVDYSSARGEKSMVQRLAGEILDAIAGKGASLKKREDVHKMAAANRAFAHYRW